LWKVETYRPVISSIFSSDKAIVLFALLAIDRGGRYAVRASVIVRDATLRAFAHDIDATSVFTTRSELHSPPLLRRKYASCKVPGSLFARNHCRAMRCHARIKMNAGRAAAKHLFGAIKHSRISSTSVPNRI
jgi:hypothetical protein